MKRISVYFRKGDGIYVIPDGFTLEGGRCHTEPFEFLPLNSTADEIWAAMERSLKNANQTVPHPKPWEEETAWYRKAGVKTWRQFCGKAEAISLIETEQEYVFNRLDWSRGAFIGRGDSEIIVLKSASHEQLIAALKTCLARETNFSTPTVARVVPAINSLAHGTTKGSTHSLDSAEKPLFLTKVVILPIGRRNGP